MIKTHNPEGWKRPSGFSNAVSASGRMVFIAGQIGWDENQKFVADDFISQTRQALLNVKACLEAAGAAPSDIVRMTWYVIDKQEYNSAMAKIGEIYLEIIGRHYPAMSLIEVRGLLEPKARLEIEVTAVVEA